MLDRFTVGGTVKIVSSKRGVVTFSVGDKTTTMPKDMFEAVFPTVDEKCLGTITDSLLDVLAMVSKEIEHKFLLKKKTETNFVVAQELTEDGTVLEINKLWTVARKIARGLEAELEARSLDVAEVKLGQDLVWNSSGENNFVSIEITIC